MNVIAGGTSKMDQIEKIGHSLIQHGKNNDRIYLLKYKREDFENIHIQLDLLAKRNGYSKIIAKVPASSQPVFLQNGYDPEAYIPDFYDGKEGVFFMAKYFTQQRSVIKTAPLTVFSELFAETNKNKRTELPAHLKTGIMEVCHANEMAKLYQEVFKTYPFPITNAGYLTETMKEGKVIYFGIRDQEKLIGLSSAELDESNLNAEMTDFAVLHKYRGQNLAGVLLAKMEAEMKKRQYKTLYTIARLNSPGMNKTFIKEGYHFSGLLKNNTNISGQIESMNVYYKTLKLC